MKASASSDDDDTPLSAHQRRKSPRISSNSHSHTSTNAAKNSAAKNANTNAKPKARKKGAGANTNVKNSKQSDKSVKKTIKKPTISKTKGGSNNITITKIKKEKKEEIDEEMEKLTKNFKEGQRHKCPPTGDGTRAFYESLLQENGNSLTAIKYCIEHGVLSGTLYHEKLKTYNHLKQLGAWKGNSLGGIHPMYKDGIPEKVIKSLK